MAQQSLTSDAGDVTLATAGLQRDHSSPTAAEADTYSQQHVPWMQESLRKLAIFEPIPSSSDGFFKGCFWAADGSCLLTFDNNNRIRIFDLPHQAYQLAQPSGGEHEQLQPSQPPPPLVPAVDICAGSLIYDCCFHPLLASTSGQNCFVAATSQDHPINLWDAFSGKLAATYRAYNHLDEIDAAYSLCYSSDGAKLLSGFQNCVRVFDSERPGRAYQQYRTFTKKSGGQKGIISSMALDRAAGNTYACGSYGCSVGLYDLRTSTPFCVLPTPYGVTHVKFSPDGNYVYAGLRRCGDIICFDARNFAPLFKAGRCLQTNQRLYFDLDATGRYLYTGGQDGTLARIDVFATQPSQHATDDDAAYPFVLKAEATSKVAVHRDSVNGVSLHPWLPVVATTSGQRHFGVDMKAYRGPERRDKAVQTVAEIEEQLLEADGGGHLASAQQLSTDSDSSEEDSDDEEMAQGPITGVQHGRGSQFENTLCVWAVLAPSQPSVIDHGLQSLSQ